MYVTHVSAGHFSIHRQFIHSVRIGLFELSRNSCNYYEQLLRDPTLKRTIFFLLNKKIVLFVVSGLRNDEIYRALTKTIR